MPGMIWPVVAYAPNAAIKPIIAIQPLNFSASGVIRKKQIYLKKIKEKQRKVKRERVQ